MVDSLGPRLARREIRAKTMKNIADRTIEIAINTGVAAVGAVRRFGELLGRTDKSIWPLTLFMGTNSCQHTIYRGYCRLGTCHWSFVVWTGTGTCQDNEDSVKSDYRGMSYQGRPRKEKAHRLLEMTKDPQVAAMVKQPGEPPYCEGVLWVRCTRRE